ncbi:MAG: spore cortex-lytic enzyme [Thermobacillus sp. ZCTH02-B1]|uniref:spore cortex-lytic enzyme n=1 Tax=Thermobacillus sp. ZCTH02-B1 TaxID=1858795 RepID=UPI000B551ABF|nr:spore cortex-lytic enzyme [Thermobacillus sp. ZCTH02-B1]OUM96619.1 MAG: spore cortex-lytic enzyme [Thermobacillus sp. ZCTH02-B1]
MKKLRTLLILCVLIAGTAAVGAPAGAEPLLKQGSRGDYVWDLQYRLKTIDLFDQELTGYFGEHTRQAVVKFQKKYGLQADGIVGPATWKALRKYTLNKSEMDIMARIIHGEARGEPYKGQVAVGAVVMNRIRSNQFPDTIRGVVFQPGAFTAVSDGQYWLAPNATAYKAALDAVRGWDPTGGALYYFNPKTATSKWIWSRPQTVTIGNHIFAK